jgi:adenosylcobinamide-GDP ribazoletransferase
VIATQVRSVRAAVGFLTRVPVGGFPYAAVEQRWAAAHFPLVGAALGGLLGAVDHALLPLGRLPAALLTLAVSLLLTGAFHEDGLADTSDALGGAFDRERILAILKDSRVGTFGACALVVSIGGRASLLAELGDGAAWALPLALSFARVGPLWQMVALPYATPDAVSRSRDVARAGVAQAAVATAWGAAVALVLVHMGHLAIARAGAAAALVSGVTLLTGWRYARRVGGVTGDFLGATEQLGELAVLAALAWGHP